MSQSPHMSPQRATAIRGRTLTAAQQRPAWILGISLIAVLVIDAILVVIHYGSPSRKSAGLEPPPKRVDISVAAATTQSVEIATAATSPATAPVSTAPSTGAPAVAATQPRPAARRPLDLLSKIELARDVAAGQWRQVAGGIASDESKNARVSLPYEPPAEYDFRIEFTRSSGNNESVVQIFRDRGHDCTWVMNGWKGTVCAFNGVGGKNGPDNPTAVRDIELKQGQRHTAVVKVRKAYIEAYIDDKLISHYETDGSDLRIGKEWNVGRKSLGVGSNANSTVFHAIEVMEISGKGKTATTPLAFPATQPAKPK